MFSKIKTTEQYFQNKLAAALRAEQMLLDLLERLAAAAQSSNLEQTLCAHAEQAEHQLTNLRGAVGQLGYDAKPTRAPAAQALHKECKQVLRKAEQPTRDGIAASGAVEAEMHTTAVYAGLIAQAEALGHAGVADRLRQNLVGRRRTVGQIAELMRAALATSAAATP